MPKVKYEESTFSWFLSAKAIVLLSNFIFQGIRYMTWGEKIYKIAITTIFSFMLYIFVDDWLLSIIAGHLLNYIFNGQYYVVFRYLSSKKVMSMVDLNNFLEYMIKKSLIHKPKDILIIGSFCRGKMSRSSDLDIRIYHNNDLFSSLSAYTMASKLRFYGLFSRFPIDVYCFSDLSFLNKINKDEVPINMFRNIDFLRKYPSSKNIDSYLDKLIIE